MSELLAELRAKWNQALATGSGGREWRGVALARPSPVTVLAGIRDRDNRISLLVETALKNGPRQRVRLHAEGISLVDQRISDEGLLRLAVTLERPDLQDIFEVLAVDLAVVATAHPSPAQCVAQIIRRLEAWQACLRVRQRGLSREEQAGLIGELAFAMMAGEQIGVPQALDAWSGPMDGLHDFQSAGIAAEVKTTIGASHQIIISRIDQLNTQGIDMLLLVRARLQEQPEGLTLPEHINGIRKILSDRFPNAVGAFEDKILRAGYLDADADLYGALKTGLQEIYGFSVASDFPRLARDNLPQAVVEASYSLDERQLAVWRLTAHDFASAVRRMSVSV